MKQEIVPFIDNYPVIFIILCVVAGWLAGTRILFPWLKWMLAPRTRWNMFGQCIKKPKPADGVDEKTARNLWNKGYYAGFIDDFNTFDPKGLDYSFGISLKQVLADLAAGRNVLFGTERRERESVYNQIGKKAELFPRDYVLTKEDEAPYGNIFRDALAELKLADNALEKAMTLAGVDLSAPSPMTATGVLNSEREKEHAAAFAFYDKRLAEGDSRAAAQIAIDLAIQFHEIGMTPEIQQRLAPLFQATIKAHMTPTPSAAPEAAEKTGEAYKSNVATGIRSLPQIDLYNLLAGEDTLEDHYSYTNRIINKWDDSPKEKRPAVLRVCMNTAYGQYVANFLKTFGIPVEPKERP